MPKYLNPIAEIGRPDSGNLALPENAYKHRKTQRFFCPDNDCLDNERILIPSKSKLGNYFFRHKSGCKHEIRLQTMLHKMAVKWFEGKDVFEIPPLSEDGLSVKLNLDSLKTQLEYRKLKKIIPDVKLTTIDSFQVAIEIVVSNDISKEKNELIRQLGLPTISVDLTNFYTENPYQCRVDYDFVSKNLDQLLNDINLKEWVIKPNSPKKVGKSELSDKSKDENIGCIIGLIIGGFFYLLNRFK